MYRVLSGRHLGNAFQQLCTSAIFLHHLRVGQRDIRIGEGRTGHQRECQFWWQSFTWQKLHPGLNFEQNGKVWDLHLALWCSYLAAHFVFFFFSDVRRVLWVRHHEACPFSFFLYSFLCLSCTTAEWNNQLMFFRFQWVTVEVWWRIPAWFSRFLLQPLLPMV